MDVNDTDEPASITLHNLSPWQLARARKWCQARWGSPWAEENPTGTWIWQYLPGTGLVITLPDQGSAVEMRLVEPWNT